MFRVSLEVPLIFCQQAATPLPPTRGPSVQRTPSISQQSQNTAFHPTRLVPTSSFPLCVERLMVREQPATLPFIVAVSHELHALRRGRHCAEHRSICFPTACLSQPREKKISPPLPNLPAGRLSRTQQQPHGTYREQDFFT